MRYLSKLDLKKFAHKTCFLRIDLNVDGGEERDSLRLEAIIPTVKLFLKNKIRVLILSHRGRPNSKDKNLSLRPFAAILSQKIGEKVIFLPDFKATKNLKKPTKNKVFLFENLRFWSGEAQNDPKFVRKLAILGDFYVNEAFPASHRENASISAITRFLPVYLGLRFEEEIKNLSGFLKVQRKPLTVILGGAKVEDKAGVIRYFWQKADYFLLGGGPANTFFALEGLPVGDSLIDKKAKSPIPNHLKANNKILLPIDTKIKNREILDIGNRTVREYAKIIKKSKTIIWAGPMGYYQKKGFENGTKGIWRAILANRKARIAVGGGETVASIKLLGIRELAFRNKNIFLSTGGGAMLEFLSGKKLTGIN